MGILDKIVDATNALGKRSGDNPAMLDSVVDIFKRDGVGGIVDSFKQKGLGETVKSWVGNGPNMPISTDQIKDVLGSEKLKQIAMKAGVSEENASKFLQDVLPGIIDRITPGGQIESDDQTGPVGPDSGSGAPGGGTTPSGGEST